MYVHNVKNELLRGRHTEAYLNLKDFYRQQLTLSQYRVRNGIIKVLDFGSGRYGAARSIFESIYDPPFLLDAYDNGAEVSVSYLHEGKTRRVNADTVYGKDGGNYDIVNIAYVLCTMLPEEAERELELLRARNPEALFTIVDYTLKGRDRNEVLRRLNCDEENKWKRINGDTSFCETRSRFDAAGLQQLCREARLRVNSVVPLDREDLRTAITAVPEGGIY